MDHGVGKEGLLVLFKFQSAFIASNGKLKGLFGVG